MIACLTCTVTSTKAFKKAQVFRHKQNWIKSLPHYTLNVKVFQTQWDSGPAGSSCPSLTEGAVAGHIGRSDQ